jgi:hypothetical protein
MHEHADDYGFGSKEVNLRLSELLKEISKSTGENRRVADSIQDLIHYITFDIKRRSGESPPPPPPNGKT